MVRQKPGNTEIQQLRSAVLRHQNVGRFEIAVNDEVLVGELYRIAHLPEQLQPLTRASVVRAAPDVDGHAGDELHDQVRRSVGSHTAIDQPRHVGMFETGQDLAFLPKAPFQGAAHASGGDDLNGDLLRELPIGALSAIHRPHAARADSRDQPPGPETGSRRHAGRNGQRIHRKHRGFQKPAGVLPRIQQLLDPAPHFGSEPGTLQVRPAGGRGKLHGIGEGPIHFAPGVLGHWQPILRQTAAQVQRIFVARFQADFRDDKYA